MKVNELRELRERTKEELEAKLLEIKKSLFALKFQKATGQLDNPVKIRNLRKDIARIETLLREKELNRKKELIKENAGIDSDTEEEAGRKQIKRKIKLRKKV